MISRKQAEKAKQALQAQLGQPEWLQGIALGLGGTGISIRVAIVEVTDDILTRIPKSVDGVEVIIEQAIESTPFDPSAFR